MAGPLRLLRRGSNAPLADDNGLREAYQAHGGELFRFALRALGDRGAAEDVVQETFVRAWRSADRYDPTLSSLRVWLFAIVRNVVIDQARHRTSKAWTPVVADPEAPTTQADAAPDPADEVLRGWLVEEALRRLSPEHREAIVETYLRGRTYDEVAAERGIPVGTLRSRVFYALKALRIAMEEMGVAP